jgi:uncharacterized protein (TIGR02466 family)
LNRRLWLLRHTARAKPQEAGYRQFWGDEGHSLFSRDHFRGLVNGAVWFSLRAKFAGENPMLDTPTRVNPTSAASVALNEKQMFMLFPTPLFMGKLSDIGLCDRVETKLRNLQRSGVGHSSPEGAVLAYMTPDDLQTLPEMKELVDVILRESGNILDAMAVKRDSHYISNMWANIANPNRRHHLHIHPNCLLSGIVYIATPKRCGQTIFVSPRLLSKGIEPTYTQKNEINADMFSFPAEKGRMAMWPSHLPHGVEQGGAEEAQERIVVAFNIMIRGHIETHTAQLTLL